ncbi:hypothetical protein SPDO_05280 [Sphingomonas dokdonensis]|uniref:Uncharacterized protein n=1 Tax=Sphingomonas dokdonensis TaxID=344880 RepID=A0A245ZV67_9SPHN|nr:hypothetical protein SPDO_05280 [Sphingomonas dokdonensis]
MLLYSPGDLVIFRKYFDAKSWGLWPGDLLGIAHGDGDGVLTCYRLDWRGRIFERESYLLFSEEVRPVPAPTLPMKRFPPPWGVSDNEEEDQGFIWTGCHVGTA